MKLLLNYYTWLLCCCCFLSFACCNKSQAQAPADDIQDQLFKRYSETQLMLKIQATYFVVQSREGNCLNDFKGKIVRRLNDRLAIVKSAFLHNLPVGGGCLQRYAAANDSWKLSAYLETQEKLLRKKNNINTRFTVVADNIDSLLVSLSLQKITWKLVRRYNASNAAVIQCAAQQFLSIGIANRHLVFADIYLSPSTDSYVTGYRRNFNTINLTDHLFPGANGKGINIGIKEKMMDVTDMDLLKRILPSGIAAVEKEYHATTIATLAGGAGNSFYTGKGIASHCAFFPSTFSNLFPDNSMLLAQKNVTVQNHSYGTVIQSFYGAEAAAYDEQAIQNNTLIHIFSSGNMGLSAAPTGAYANQAGYANLTGNFKMAKNIITVAATDTGGNLAGFSSAGPLFDGRMAPQLTALGPNGTSEAAALVSGAAAVLQQVYKDSNAQELPPASLIKALLFTTADDVGNKGIDYKSGFGLMNIYAALKALMQKHYAGHQLTEGNSWTTNISVPPLAANFKITLVWTDTTGAINTNRALVNDLDLELVNTTTGELYLPWLLSAVSNRDSLNKLPSRQRDSLNTAEQISLDAPLPGNYLIRVRGKKIQTVAAQSFHIAYQWDTLNLLKFTNPVQSSDINREEIPVLRVQWKLTLADTNSVGKLLVSYNDGAQWTLINGAVQLNKQLLNWPIPDTASQARLKMECSFGDFYSEPFMMAPVTKLNIDYRCSDSLRMSWLAYPGAIGYQLFALADSPFLKPVQIMTDTFVVLKTTAEAATIFAVQPLLANGLNATRSEAIDVRNQGVQCFYKTFVAESVGDSIELVLNLSFPAAVQSVTFEKLGTSGTRSASIANLGPSGVSTTSTVYDQSPQAGMNYYRASIATGIGMLYTETVAVFHTGEQPLIVFPNPVLRGTSLKFRVKDITGTANLVLTDMAGRQVAKFTINTAAELKTDKFQSGLYAYTLTSAAGITLASGKLIIQ